MPFMGPISDEGIRRVQLTLVAMADIAMACGRNKEGEMAKKRWGARLEWSRTKNVFWRPRAGFDELVTLLRQLGIRQDSHLNTWSNPRSVAMASPLFKT